MFKTDQNMHICDCESKIRSLKKKAVGHLYRKFFGKTLE